ncbi:MAG: GIY-YIG nuclease family protein [Sulfurifustis sp.]
MSFYVYILQCADGSFYTGHTDNLERRLYEHSSGTAHSYTAARQPTKLVYCRTFETRLEALAAERQIKGWSHAKKKAMIAGDWAEVSRLAQSRNERPSTSLSRAQLTGSGRPSTSSGRTDEKLST